MPFEHKYHIAIEYELHGYRYYRMTELEIYHNLKNWLEKIRNKYIRKIIIKGSD